MPVTNVICADVCTWDCGTAAWHNIGCRRSMTLWADGRWQTACVIGVDSSCAMYARTTCMDIHMNYNGFFAAWGGKGNER
jgi:trans-aconitate methyltransferase